MFIIQCGKCGREQAWGMETEIGQAEIEVVNNSVMCTCGHTVEEEKHELHEFDTRVDNVDEQPESILTPKPRYT